MYDIVIIGGGISGLNLAYKFSQKSKKNSILLLEKSSRLGGRIYTSKYKNFTYELGAGRFNQNHRNLFNLIKKAGLDDKLIENSGEILYYYNKFFTVKHQKLVFLLFIKGLVKSKIPIKKLYQHTISEILKNNLDSDEYRFINSIIAYSSEFYNINAYDYFTKCLIDYHSNIPFFSLKGGLSQIPKFLIKKIKSSNINLKKNCECTKITKENNYYQVTNRDGKSYQAKKCVLAIPPKPLQNIKINFMENKITNICQKLNSNSLYRIYAIYPKINGKVWFSNLPRIISNTKLRYIIPINKEKGLIMISYTDGKYADALNKINLEGKLKKVIKNTLAKMFPSKKIPEPSYLTGYYWEDAVYYWKKNYSSQRDAALCQQPNPNENIFIIGDSYSAFQAWVEGGLVTSNRLYRKLTCLENTRNKTITLKELSKHNKYNDAWIALHGNVYDVTDWIPQHPGGDAILKGIGKDYTRQWEKVSSHIMNKDRISKILKTLFIGKLKV